MTDPFEKGTELVILCPSSRRLTLGLGSDAAPVDFPNIVAYQTTHPQEVSIPASSREEDIRRERALNAARMELGITNEHPTAVAHSVTALPSDMMHPEYKILTGEAVLKLKGSEPYRIVYPCGLGGLDPHRTDRQLQSDLGYIWTSAVSFALNIDPVNFPSYAVVLIVPDDYGLGDVEVMVEALLVEMKFKEVVVHSDSTAAVFGQGMSGGCIVHVEDTSVRISCIEDGVLVQGSLKRLPFGAVHIADCLKWMVEDKLSSSQPFSGPRERHQWDTIRDRTCFLLSEGPVSALESEIRNLPSVETRIPMTDGSEVVWELCMGIEACLAPMGLFFPDLLLSYSIGVDHQRISLSDDYYTHLSVDNEAVSKQYPFTPLSVMSLDAAIVQSISSAENVDHRRHLYTSILIAGPCSNIKGLSDMVERRVLMALPSDEVIDTVAVLEPKWPSHHLIWKGGAVLGILSDHWIKRNEWNQEMEKPNRFGKRELPRSKVFWMFKTEIGRM